MMDHFVPAQPRTNDDRVKPLQPVLDGTQGFVIDLMLLVLCQLQDQLQGEACWVACITYRTIAFT